MEVFRGSAPRFVLHIKNNRAGEMIFRVTPERFADACRRHPEIADQIEARIDWDLDHMEPSLADADAVVTWDLPTAGLRERAPKLKWIHIIGAGVEHLQPLDWLPEDLLLINNKGVHAAKAEEYASMALMMLNARMPRLLTQQRAHLYESLFTGGIAGKTLLVVGAGHMGRAVGRAGKKLGLKTLGTRREAQPTPPFDEIHPADDLDRLLPHCDFLALTVPLTDQTRGLMNADRFASMKPGAGLINMSRAGTIVETALAESLERGQLAGAILDVVDPEPLPASSALWDLPGLILTPHVSSDDAESYIPLTLDLIFSNLARQFAGQPLANQVSPSLGY